MRVHGGSDDEQQGGDGRDQKDRGEETKPTSPASALLDHFHDVPGSPRADLGRIGT
jgi:hypothetical protein